LIHEDDAAFSHEVDHVISQQHGGVTTVENLAYACMLCNRLKGTNLASVALSGQVVTLFNPRSDQWNDHFRLNAAVIEPLTPAAEATARVLRLNDAKRVVERTVLQRLGRYPRG
jgi:HNH endonuclease